eukprot:gene19897-25852_t
MAVDNNQQPLNVNSANYNLNQFYHYDHIISKDSKRLCDIETEDDLASCSSDGESYSSKFTDKLSFESCSQSSITSEYEEPGSPRDSLQVSSTSNPRSYHLDFDLSREAGVDIYDITDLGSVHKFIDARIESGLETGAFLVTNLRSVVSQFHLWKKELPMITPFYAVKCLPDIAVLRLLAALGCSFDCATMGEMDLILNGLGDDLNFSSRGLAGSSIVYANPAKMTHMIEYAVDNGVIMTVFDGEDELEKISKVEGHENLQLLIRLTTDDKDSICQFSKKFGCPVDDAPRLLKIAKDLGLNVTGVCFHVGSGCGDANAYKIALEHSRRVFDEAEKLGMSPLSIIDIGGGFPGDAGGYGGPDMPTFQDLAAAIREGLKQFFVGFKRPASSVRVIAEPGRFFVSASTLVATQVYSRKGGHSNTQALYVDDGVYGSFNNILYDHATPVPIKLTTAINKESADPLLSTSVFGPTCDGLDQMCSYEAMKLPKCEVGDWLIWENMGAYTHTASFVFN